MYLDIVLIDYLSPNGVLTTYRITPRDARDRVVIDRLSDIDMNFGSRDALNIGGTRVYNTSNCSIQVQQARLRQVMLSESDKSVSFSFEHMGIPVGSQRQAHGGYYNFILPPGFRFTELHVVDPYDHESDPVKKKHFKYDILWDTSCSTSLVNMFLTSSRGTFSFILFGTARVFDKDAAYAYCPAREDQYAVSGLLDYHIFSSKERKALADDIADKSDWLELKPNFMGIGINLNQVIKDSIRAFGKKIRSRTE